jgi:hypothetical protein
MKPVIVTAKDGLVVHPSQNNPVWGYIRVIQEKTVFEDSFGKIVTESALVLGKLKDLHSFGWTEGQELDGQVVTKESHDPFSKSYPDKNLKIAGKTGVVCTKEGLPIYRKNFYTLDMTDRDAFIKNDNILEIKAKQAELNESSETAITANEEFEV